jgi:hypothetical protein
MGTTACGDPYMNLEDHVRQFHEARPQIRGMGREISEKQLAKEHPVEEFSFISLL